MYRVGPKLQKTDRLIGRNLEKDVEKNGMDTQRAAKVLKNNRHGV